MTSRSIELHIEQLVLHGVEQGDRAALAAAIAAEIGRLLSLPGTPAALERTQSVDRLDGGSIRAREGATGLGQAIGRAVAGRLTS